MAFFAKIVQKKGAKLGLKEEEEEEGGLPNKKMKKRGVERSGF